MEYGNPPDQFRTPMCEGNLRLRKCIVTVGQDSCVRALLPSGLLTRTVNLSQYLTNLMHKICFIISFISCLYMFRAHVLETCRGMK